MDFSSLYAGLDTDVPLLDGSLKRYINLDNAASTPAFKAVAESIVKFLEYYASVHRGAGFKSQLSTHAYESARRAVLDFVGADASEDVCIFGKNTTEAINKLAKRFPFTGERDVTLASVMEHHSNDLPWRAVSKVVYVEMTPDGRLDEADFDAKLEQYAGRVAIVAISGGSNVTGYINPVHALAEKAHAAGAQILVDCAQLAPHRKVDMRAHGDPAHLDYVALSAHKLYAPFGTGALVGRRETFARGDPDMRGGGEVEIVTTDRVEWSEPPERDEAGSPNTVGAVALATAIRQLQAVGMDTVAAHEAELTAHALRRLKEVPGLALYGDPDPGRASDRLGVISFQMEGMSHFLVAAILGYEFGIGVRNGCFCAHPYILRLLQVNEDRAAQVRSTIMSGDRSEVPGLVRASFGLYNRLEDVDALAAALVKIRNEEFQGEYVQDMKTGEFHPQSWDVKYDDYFCVEKFVL